VKAKNDIRQFGARHFIETPHVTHVADLAMALFDGFSPLDGVPATDRDLLFTAASLHDIGYAADPAHHAAAGVSILLKHPLPCFTPTDWRSIVAVVRLHQRDWRAQMEDAWFAAFGRGRLERIKILAAILRIADGLDHGRIQDARVLYCKRGKRSDQAGIGWTWYPNNIPWAEGKADLWAAVFRRPFRLESIPEPHTDLFGGAVNRKDNALSAARKLLNTQYAIMRDCLPKILETYDPDCLHDYRVAMRRFRMLLKMFKSVLPENSRPALVRKLARMLQKLGPIRDAHVQLELFRRIEVPEGQPKEAGRFLEAAVAHQNEALAKLLQSSDSGHIAESMGRFLRVEIPEKERSGTVKSYPALAEKYLYRMLRSLPVENLSAIRKEPDKMHETRKRFRKARYCAEFAVPALGEDVRQITKQLKAACTALGRVRDIRRQIEMLKTRGVQDVKHLEVQCEDEWVRFFKARKRLIRRLRELKYPRRRG
jgi:CHAD domain-containing protein